MKDIELSVVFSFRNEEENIPELLDRCGRVLAGITSDYELIFVNDASTDRSVDILIAARKKDPRIKSINMSRRFGVAPCVWAGLRHSRGQGVVMMDADLQDPPELIPDLVKKWREGAAVVNTVRLSRAGESKLKLWLTRRAYHILRRASTVGLQVEAGDYKLFDRSVVRELLRLNEKDPYPRGLVAWVGFKQETVHYHREKRFSGETHFPLWGTGPFKNFLAGLLSFSEAPLHVSLVLGFLVSGGAFLYLAAVVIMKVLGMNIPGWSAIMATLLFLGGTQLLVLGVLGLYIGRIYGESKGRPNYIIESMSGIESGPEDNPQ